MQADRLNNEGKNCIEFQKNDENSHDLLALAKDKSQNTKNKLQRLPII